MTTVELTSELECELRNTVDWGKNWLADLNLFRLTSLITGAIDAKQDGSILEEKSSFKMMGLSLFSKLNWGSYIVSIAKTAPLKIRSLIRSMKFFPAEVALYKSTMQPCIEYGCHVCASATTWIC